VIFTAVNLHDNHLFVFSVSQKKHTVSVACQIAHIEQNMSLSGRHSESIPGAGIAIIYPGSVGHEISKGSATVTADFTRPVTHASTYAIRTIRSAIIAQARVPNGSDG
jgi:hypothetical protein